MTKNLENKVRENMVVDTKNYRYILKEDDRTGKASIVRIPLHMVGTTDALDDSNYKVVKTY